MNYLNSRQSRKQITIYSDSYNSLLQYFCIKNYKPLKLKPVMKKYVLFCFFAFQVSIYSQNSTVSNPNSEKTINTSEIDNCNSDKKTQLNNPSCTINNLIILKDSDELTSNIIDSYQNQQTSLDVSKRIKKDYLVFNFNILTVADTDND